MTRWTTIIFGSILLMGCGKGGAATTDSGPPSVGAATSTASVAPPAPKTPQQLLDDHRDEMAAAAEAGQYTDACKGTPWVNATICNWVAARAAGKGVERPDGELFRAYFGREHWKHAYGQIVGDADENGDYEVSVGGYRHHCVLDTDETKFSTKGAFNLWVQEQPETRDVTVNSGSTQQWVVLEEATLAKMLMDLAHTGGGIEGTALAKNAMALIARYRPYSERKGELPTVPGAPPGAAAAVPAAPAGATPTGSTSAASAGAVEAELAPCCAALEQGRFDSSLVTVCRMKAMSAYERAADRKRQLRNNATALNAPPLPPACQ